MFLKKGGVKMPVLKNKTQGNFVIVSRNIAEDKLLKLIDRGLLLTLLSLPDKWDFSIRGLTKILPEGKAAIQSSLERLIEAGYVKRTQMRNERGKFGDIQIEVFDHKEVNSPCTENRDTGNRDTEKRVPENQPQLNNNKSNNQRLNNNQCYIGSGKEKQNGIFRQGNRKDNGQHEGEWTQAERDLYGI